MSVTRKVAIVSSVSTLVYLGFAVLGKRFSGLVAIQPGHMLVTGGIYRHIRNPSYLGLLVNSIAWRARSARVSACCRSR